MEGSPPGLSSSSMTQTPPPNLRWEASTHAEPGHRSLSCSLEGKKKLISQQSFCSLEPAGRHVDRLPFHTGNYTSEARRASSLEAHIAHIKTRKVWHKTGVKPPH